MKRKPQQPPAKKKKDNNSQYFDHVKLSKNKQVQELCPIKLNSSGQVVVVTIARNKVVVPYSNNCPSLDSLTEGIPIHHSDRQGDPK